jgi:hypothetical protein
MEEHLETHDDDDIKASQQKAWRYREHETDSRGREGKSTIVLYIATRAVSLIMVRKTSIAQGYIFRVLACIRQHTDLSMAAPGSHP